MAEQLHHLLRMSARPYISLRIVPNSIGAHAGIAGSFNMLKFAKITPIIFLDSENSSLIIEETEAVKGYLMVVKALDRTAFDKEQSRRLINNLVT